MARRRELNVFSLSFLDIMSCGFGAVILVFIIIDHSSNVTEQEVNAELITEVQEIERDLQNRTRRLRALQEILQETEAESRRTEARAEQLQPALAALRGRLAELNDEASEDDDSTEALKARLRELEAETERLRASIEADPEGERARAFVGEGDRQYLTGLRAGGKRILILLDSSASMLDSTLVNIIRRRNLPVAEQLEAPKWQRAIRVVEWVFANLPSDSSYQVFLFNHETRPLDGRPVSKWLDTNDRELLDAGIAQLKKEQPKGGTNLHAAFTAITKLSPPPDNVFLLTDSLPTRDATEPRRSVIDSRGRVKLFRDALKVLPRGVPVNIILFPMEGDPMAASLMWQLAQISGGSFMSPTEDWP